METNANILIPRKYGASSSADGNDKVKVTVNDTTANYLASKLSGATNKITFSVSNGGGDEGYIANIGSDVFDKSIDTTDDITEGVTNLFYTALRAQDAVGGILSDSSEIHFTYTSGVSITASIITGSIANSKLVNSSIAVTGNTGSVDISLGGSLNIVGGTDISTSMSAGTLTINFTGSSGSSEWTRSTNDLYPNTPTTTNVLIGGTTAGGSDHIFNADGSAVLNEQGASVDIRAETSVSANSIFLKGSNGYLGIGTNSPDTNLHLLRSGSTGLTYSASFAPIAVFQHSNTTTDDALIYAIAGATGYAGFVMGNESSTAQASMYYNNNSTLLTISSNGNINLQAGANGEVVINDNSSDVNLRYETNNDQYALYGDGGTDAIAVGTNVVSTAKFSVVQDVSGASKPPAYICQDHTAGAQPVLTLKQDDTDKAFINHVGSIGTNCGDSMIMSGVKTMTGFIFVREDVSGSTFYKLLYRCM